MFSAMVTYKEGFGSFLPVDDDPKMGAVVVMVWLDVLLVYLLAFMKDDFFKYTLALCVVVTIPCTADAFLLKSDFPMMAVLTDVVVLLNIIVVPATVMQYRRTFWPLLGDAEKKSDKI